VADWATSSINVIALESIGCQAWTDREESEKRREAENLGGRPDKYAGKLSVEVFIDMLLAWRGR